MTTSAAWTGLVKPIAADRIDRLVFAATAALVGLGYSVMLPFAFTQRISFANWRYLDTRYFAFTVAFALVFAWLITLQVHAMRALLASRSRASHRGGLLGGLAVVGSIMPSLLCCSPILPTLVATLGFSGATSLQLQYVFATKESLFLGAALALLLASSLWSMRKLARAACLTGQGCGTPTGDPDTVQAAIEENGHVTAPALAGSSFWSTRSGGER